MTDTIIYTNPFFYANLSKPEIKYNKTYPFTEFENQILSGGIEESTITNITLLEAKKRTIKYPKLIGFYFRTGISEIHIDTTSGTAVFYLELLENMSPTNKSSDGGVNKYTLYLLKYNKYIKESIWYAKDDDDYMGGLDYINITLSSEDISKIKGTLENLDTQVLENTGTNAPETTNGSLTKYTEFGEYPFVEYFIYVWEEINDPWFSDNGQTCSFFPDLNQIGNENTGVLNCHQTNFYNESQPGGLSANSTIGNPKDDIEGFKLYTQNHTTDYTADTSSNYIKIYRLSAGPTNDFMPINNQINIIEPKYGNVYAFWTYRIVGAGKFIIDDFTMDQFSGYTPREVPIKGNFPFFTPGIKIDQETIDDDVGEWYQERIISNDWKPWKWSHLTISSDGTDISEFSNIKVFRQFKPKNKPIIQYINQRLKITIPPGDIEDLSNNFISRYRPDRERPRFKTLAGDIYIHPYENDEIINCWFKIYVFKDVPNQIVKDSQNNSLNIKPEYGNEIEGITYNWIIILPEALDNPIYNYGHIYFNDTSVAPTDVFDLQLIQGNIYNFNVSDSVFKDHPISFSITQDGTHGGGEEYKIGITLVGESQGTAGSYITFIPSEDSPRILYIYTQNEVNTFRVINIITNNEEIRNYDTENYPYEDKYVNILADEVYTLNDNPLKYLIFQDSNFDFFDVELQDRGDWAYKDASGGNASVLIEDNKALSDISVNEPIWLGYEEYTPDNIQILRPYLVDLKSYPFYIHMLNVPVGTGWYTNWKSRELFPITSEQIIDISDNEYYIRWGFEYHKYNYDKTNRYDPRNLNWTDVSFNNGISPYTYFDFTQYGKIYKPKPIIMTYKRKEYPNAPYTYYKNLKIEINPTEIGDLSTNVVYNTDLACQISFQFYIIKPKHRMDIDQNDPLIDISVNLFNTYDLSFNLAPAGSQMFPPSLSVDISDTKINSTTLLPGRYIGIWSYTVQHNWINAKARSYPLIPGIDYFAESTYVDIGYNEFLYDNNEPIFKIPNDLSRMSIELSGNDINGLINMWDTYYKNLLTDNSIITFNILVWSPNYEYSQLLSGDRRWELPDDYIGDKDLRISQTPVEYIDTTQIVPIQRVWLGNDNSDSVGAIYDWGFAGEPGIQYRKVTYRDISLNEIYNYKYNSIDISSGDPAVSSAAFDISQVIQFNQEDISANNFMIEFFIPAQTEDLSQNQAFWGFSNSPVNAMITTDEVTYRQNFHIGINGNGADTKWMTDVGAPTFKQESFIYKPPYDPEVRTSQQHYVRYRLDVSQNNTLRYHFMHVPTRGVSNNVIQTGQQDVIIYLNGEKIFDYPGWGVTLDQITHIGQSYDASFNPIVQRPITAKFLFPDISNTLINMKDLSNTSVVINTFVPQDFDAEDTEWAFYQSQNFVSNGLYVPYLSRWEYTIYDPSNDLILKSSIIKTEYPNEIQRVADWEIGQQTDGGAIIYKSENYPFEHFYRYASLLSVPGDFIAPEPFYPTENLDLSYNVITKELIVTFGYDTIIYPLLINLQRYWVQDKHETIVTFYLYVWYPNSTKLPPGYTTVDDIKDYHLWEDVYDISYSIVSSSPYIETNILPSIPYNVYTITDKELIYGKWVMAWNYRVVNDSYKALDRQRPDYINFDVSAVEIDIPPILYNPREPSIEYFNSDEYKENEKIKVSISSSELTDLSQNIHTQLKGLQDVSGIKINYYLWSPNKELHNKENGWKIPNTFYGIKDQRIYGAPVLYEEQEDFNDGKYKVYFNDASNGEYGFHTLSAIKKTINIDLNEGSMVDASCVYYSYNEIWDPSNIDLSGQIPFSDKFNNIPYLARWSFEIERTNLPSYYSDISDNIYYRNPYWNIITDSSGFQMIEDYDKINKYRYANLFPLAPKEEPIVIILEDEGLCFCPENEKSITKTKELTNYKERVSTMMKNFRYAKRLRPKPASIDQRATNPDVKYKYPNSCE